MSFPSVIYLWIFKTIIYKWVAQFVQEKVLASSTCINNIHNTARDRFHSFALTYTWKQKKHKSYRILPRFCCFFIHFLFRQQEINGHRKRPTVVVALPSKKSPFCGAQDGTGLWGIHQLSCFKMRQWSFFLLGNAETETRIWFSLIFYDFLIQVYAPHHPPPVWCWKWCWLPHDQ